MKIACLCWGSLIWDDERNKDFNKCLEGNSFPPSWKEGGPFLPIEFAR